MYTALLALTLTLVVAIVPTLFGVSAGWTVIPGCFIGILTFMWINRRIAKRVEAVTQAADAEMSAMRAMANRRSPNAQGNMLRSIDKAVARLKTGFIFRKWQIGVGVMLNARVGMLLYTKWLLMQQFGQKKNLRPILLEAIPFLEASRVKGIKARLLHALWPAWCMLAVAQYKGNKSVEKAVEVLESTTKVSKKTGLIWSLYAWILWKEKRLDEAIAVLVRGKEVATDDRLIAENLNALQNRKKMKMTGYGEQWYQFGLEAPKMAGAQQQMGHPRMRGAGRRR